MSNKTKDERVIDKLGRIMYDSLMKNYEQLDHYTNDKKITNWLIDLIDFLDSANYTIKYNIENLSNASYDLLVDDIMIRFNDDGTYKGVALCVDEDYFMVSKFNKSLRVIEFDSCGKVDEDKVKPYKIPVCKTYNNFNTIKSSYDKDNFYHYYFTIHPDIAYYKVSKYGYYKEPSHLLFGCRLNDDDTIHIYLIGQGCDMEIEDEEEKSMIMNSITDVLYSHKIKNVPKIIYIISNYRSVSDKLCDMFMYNKVNTRKKFSGPVLANNTKEVINEIESKEECGNMHLLEVDADDLTKYVLLLNNRKDTMILNISPTHYKKNTIADKFVIVYRQGGSI